MTPARDSLQKLCAHLETHVRQERQAIELGAWNKMQSLLAYKKRLWSKIQGIDASRLPIEVAQAVQTHLEAIAQLETDNAAALQECMKAMRAQMSHLKEQWKAQNAYAESWHAR